MAKRTHANNISTTLSSAIVAATTSIVVVSATGLPTIVSGEVYRLTLSSGAQREIVEVTSASGATLTVTRGVESTTAQSFPAGATVELRATADSLDRKLDKPGYTTTATAAGTTTLTVGSTEQQFFTGTTTQTVVLPVTSTLVTGQNFTIVNKSTGVVTVQSSGLNTILAMAADTKTTFTCILTSGTTAASWSYTIVSSVPGGSTTQIQYNNAGVFGGDSGFTTNGAGAVNIVGDLDVDNLNFNGNVISSTDANGNITFTPNGSGYGVFSGTNAVQVPVGTTAQRPTATNGMIRYNSTLFRYEGVAGASWTATQFIIDGDFGINGLLTKSAANTYSGIAGTQGDLIYSSAASTWSTLAKNTTATRYLSNTGTSNNPAWAQVNLADGVTGVLSIANGGNGISAMPGYTATLSAGTNINNSTFTKIPCNTEVFDTTSAYDNVTNFRFTPLTAGTYLVIVHLEFDTFVDTSRMIAAIYKNGVIALADTISSSGTGQQGTSVIGYIALNGSTDYIEGYGHQTTGSAQTMNTNCFTSAYWVGP